MGKQQDLAFIGCNASGQDRPGPGPFVCIISPGQLGRCASGPDGPPPSAQAVKVSRRFCALRSLLFSSQLLCLAGCSAVSAPFRHVPAATALLGLFPNQRLFKCLESHPSGPGALLPAGTYPFLSLPTASFSPTSGVSLLPLAFLGVPSLALGPCRSIRSAASPPPLQGWYHLGVEFALESHSVASALWGPRP